MLMPNRFLFPDDPNYPTKRRLWVRDPVDGSHVLCNVSRDKFFDWCELYCIGRYWVGMGFIDFELEDDYAFALLVHS